MPGPAIFDRHLLRTRQRRARARGPATFLLEHVAAELAERLAAVLRTFDVAVDLGTPTDSLRRDLAAGGKIATVIAAEPAAAALDARFPRVAADEEALPFADGALDLVVSALALQWVNDLPGTFVQIPSTPSSISWAMRSGSSTVQTFTSSPWAFAAATSSASTTPSHGCRAACPPAATSAASWSTDASTTT